MGFLRHEQFLCQLLSCCCAASYSNSQYLDSNTAESCEARERRLRRLSSLVPPMACGRVSLEGCCMWLSSSCSSL